MGSQCTPPISVSAGPWQAGMTKRLGGYILPMSDWSPGRSISGRKPVDCVRAWAYNGPPHVYLPSMGPASSHRRVRFPRRPWYSRKYRPGGTEGRVRKMVFKAGLAQAREFGSHSVRTKKS